MSLKESNLPILTFLAIVFTIALTFATLELPRLMGNLFKSYFPELFYDFEQAEAFLNYVRPIGYACLVIVIALIVVGFVIERRHLSILGSLAFFLPTFGYFSISMFFLSGLGILRVLWIPFWDVSIDLLRLGDIVYLPHLIIVYPVLKMGVNVQMPLTFLTICIGLLLFCFGTVTWFYGKSENRGIIEFWIYKYSRHPQYLGFLIWSYGVLILVAHTPCPRGGLCITPTFPWAISALIVICVALVEEIAIMKQVDERYLVYQRSTPFMLPLPRFLSRLITAPNRLLFKKELPSNGKEVLCTFIVYTVIFIVLSLPFLGHYFILPL